MAAGASPRARATCATFFLDRAAAALTGSAERGYVLLAILGTALAAWALYDLGRRLWNPCVGWFAALMLLSSPLYWFYGEIALPHTLDALMVIVAATLSWRVWRGEARMATTLALWLGLAGGLREQTLVFLLPLAVVACWNLPRADTTVPVRWPSLTATTLAWLLPLLSLSGGWTRYWSVVRTYSAVFDTPTSVFLGAGWHGLRHNLGKLGSYTAWAWAFGLVPLVLGFGILMRTRTTPWYRNPRVWLLALWAAPSLLFYVFIHMGQQGLIFVYLPVCLLLSARAGDALARQWKGGQTLTMACIAASALLYLFAPTYLLPGRRLKVLSESTLRDKDRELLGQIAATQSDLPPGGVLVANAWRFPQYYLPGTPLIALDAITGDDVGDQVPGGAPPVPALRSVSALAWYEPGLDALNRAPGRVAIGGDHDGIRLRVLRRAPGEHFWITPFAFGVSR